VVTHLSKLKKRLPDFLLPWAREFKYRIGSNGTEEKLQAELIDLQNQWVKIINDSSELINNISSGSKRNKILFVTGYGLGTHFLTIEPIIMMSLFLRNCDVQSLYCNMSLPACEFNPAGNNYPPCINYYKSGISKKSTLYQCNKCANNVKSTYSLLPISLYGYDMFINSTDYISANDHAKSVDYENFREWEFDDIKVGEEVFSSILRVTFKGTVNDSINNRNLVKRYISAGVLMTKAVQRAYESLRPDRVVMIHGVYLTHGLAAKVANKMGIPVTVVGGGGIRKNTAVLCHEKTYHLQLVSESNTVWEDYQLSEEQRKQVLDYAIKKRSSGGGVDYQSYHTNPIEDADELYKLLNIDRSRPIISLYTNVIWDAQIFYESNVFTNIFDWLFTSIEEFGKKSNCWLVIRIHPAEVKGSCPTQQPMVDEIRRKFPELPENVRVIPPESDISSYTLAQESRAAIIYGTKMGLEIALMQVPLIICGETFSRGKGYGLDIVSKEQYIELLKEIHNYPPVSKEGFERALRYAYYFYFRKMIDLPFTTLNSNEAGGGKRLEFANLDDLLPARNNGIDTICNGIINLTPFHIDVK
jgi:hypothetical protein